MIVAKLPTPPTPISYSGNDRRVIAFTTPQNYAGRLSHLLRLKDWALLWCPTVIVEPTPQTKSSIQHYLSSPNSRQKPPLEDFCAIAFTSRTGISAFSAALADIDEPPLDPYGETFTISALGRDSELLNESFVNRICKKPNRVRVLVPPVATPAGLAESLGLGRGNRVLCPVPLVLGLEEPPVVPNFLQDLVSKGWIPVRVNGYETRWAGPECAEAVARRRESAGEECRLDAIVFTSTGEVEGLLKSLRNFGLNWETLRKMWPHLVVAAHGPVTAAGAGRLGVDIDVVSSRFDTFDGVVDALALRWQNLEC